MRSQWYGDNRDVVKWSTLVHLARREQLSVILQVALFRPDGGIPPQLSTARGPVSLPAEVCRHFRDLDDIQRLASACGLRIEVLKTPFTKRSRYFASVVSKIRASAGERLGLFLDPDTGVAPEVPGLEHVTSDELRVTFEAMKPNDVLVCYQHARRQKDWRGATRRAFARALDVPTYTVEVFESALAKDVVLFAAVKASA